jgi:PIN domain
VLKPRIYIETSAVSYLTARPSRDFLTVARQEFTRQWWELKGTRFDAVISGLVISEIGRGNPDAAFKRAQACEGLEVLKITDEAITLSTELIRLKAIPEQEPEDALHIAIAALSDIQFIASWNFSHLVGPEPKFRLQTQLKELGYQVPLLATPQDLLEVLR